MFRTKVVEEIKTHFVFSSPPPPLNRAVYENVVKYSTAGQATDDSLTHAHFTLET
jgi:hypothetical protein